MATTETAAERPICPSCGHENIPGAAFCAQCGRSLDDEETEQAEPDAGDSQVTSVFEPVGSGSASASPWAPPVPGDVVVTDPGQTSALPASESYAWADGRDSSITQAPVEPRRQSRRGLALGVIAMVIIAAVLVLYWYWTWLSDSTRDSIQGWIP